MTRQILGIHHVTAIAGDPQTNLDFYAGVLGLRLVKLTVNYDDPGTYHLYYGDGVGHPGTILTFFPWPHAPQGRRGTGQVTETAFAIPDSAIDFWKTRLTARGIHFHSVDRFGEPVISFSDPDGLGIELIGTKTTREDRAYQEGAIPIEFAIRGFHSATLTQADHRATAELLTDTMGFKLIEENETRFRYKVDSGEAASLVDVVRAPNERAGRVLVGTVHHIAWRTPNDEQQLRWLTELSRLDYGVSPVMDRKYFHSIYYREPGNILFEIATDPPGFSVDEAAESLGTKLVLPPWLERDRAKLEASLPPLTLPVREESIV
jgi:glyoxalase family protein